MTITHIHWVRSGIAGDDLAIAYAGRELGSLPGQADRDATGRESG